LSTGTRINSHDVKQHAHEDQQSVSINQTIQGPPAGQPQPNMAPRSGASPARIQSRSWARRHLLTLLGLLFAVTVTLLFALSDSATSVNQALQVMGFDPDRASLLTALVAGGLAAATVALVGGTTVLGVLVATVAVGAFFYGTFIQETQSALASGGVQGSFDPVGWLESLVTLVVVAVIVGWAAASLAAIIRRTLVDAWGSARRLALEHPRRPRLVTLPALVVATAVLLAVTVPVFGDMINYDPNVHMLSGGPSQVGLVGGPESGVSSVGSTTAGAGPAGVGLPLQGNGSTARGRTTGTTSAGGTSAVAPAGATSTTQPGAPGSGPSTASLSLPRDLVAGQLTGSLVTPGSISTSQPWASSAPTGTGRVDLVSLPAPWTGGLTTTAKVEIYLPPGYDTSNQRYATYYEAPMSIGQYAGAVNITALLDSLITSGQIPPVIVVFAQTYGGPYADSECANSYDGTEWFDTYMATTVVQYTDSHYRTIATPASRATLGFSQGGYCAAAILSHHPNIFQSAAIISGYYVSGIRSGSTPVAWRPFANNANYIAQTSPLTVVPNLPSSVRKSLFFAFEGDPTNPFYGTQLLQFTHALDASGVPMSVFPTPMGHAWGAVRAFLPSLLQTVAERMTLLGVYR
jgi:enterochelin esterase-like enzyme